MEYISDIRRVRLTLKLMLGVLIVASVAFGLGCAGGTEVQVGQLVTGTITESMTMTESGNLRPMFSKRRMESHIHLNSQALVVTR